MGDVVNFPISLDSDLGRELIVDCVRFAEGLLDERVIRKKYRFTNDDWESLGSNELLIEKIEAEKLRRIRDGSSKREKAQQLVVKAPDVAASIMNDVGANARTVWTPVRCWTILVQMGRRERRPRTDSRS